MSEGLQFPSKGVLRARKILGATAALLLGSAALGTCAVKNRIDTAVNGALSGEEDDGERDWDDLDDWSEGDEGGEKGGKNGEGQKGDSKIDWRDDWRLQSASEELAAALGGVHRYFDLLDGELAIAEEKGLLPKWAKYAICQDGVVVLKDGVLTQKQMAVMEERGEVEEGYRPDGFWMFEYMETPSRVSDDEENSTYALEFVPPVSEDQDDIVLDAKLFATGGEERGNGEECGGEDDVLQFDIKTQGVNEQASDYENSWDRYVGDICAPNTTEVVEELGLVGDENSVVSRAYTLCEQIVEMRGY